MQEKGIKYIIGCEFYVTDDYRVKKDQHADHLILLAKNKAGYINLVQMDSLAFVDGFYYRPRIDYNVLKDHAEGVICLSACPRGQASPPPHEGGLRGGEGVRALP